jgi:hypothetical protein
MWDKIQAVWDHIQELLSLDGGLYVDAFAVVMIVRLLAVLFGAKALNASEAGMWGATIMTYGASKFGGPRQS